MRLTASVVAVLIAAGAAHAQQSSEQPKTKVDMDAVMRTLNERAARLSASSGNAAPVRPVWPMPQGSDGLAAIYAAHIRPCWAPPIGQDFGVTMRVRYKIDGTLDGQPVVLNHAKTAAYEKAAASAARALARCSPIGFPADQYARWKMMEITFSPR